MGVERAVTRWYVQRQYLLNEIALLEEKLGEEKEGESVSKQEDTDGLQQLARAQKKLRLLGPCPKPMMG